MIHTIELKKVSKFYTHRDSVSTGFSRVDLALDMGEFVVITGESGSGKSTLLNVISGLDTYEEGEMFVCGEDTTGYRTEDYERYRKIYIGNIFQDFNLVNSYSVYQNIELSMLLTGRKWRDRRKRIRDLIELVDLTRYRRTKASKLSGGQKQRVAIARALAKDAPIIVADEPTGNLDSESAKKIMETLHQISRDKLVVIVTHNYEQAEPYVTRKITMHDGKIIEDKKIRDSAIVPYEDQIESFEALNTEEEVPGDAHSKAEAVASPVEYEYRKAEAETRDSRFDTGFLYDALEDLYLRSPEALSGITMPEAELSELAKLGTRGARSAAANSVVTVQDIAQVSESDISAKSRANEAADTMVLDPASAGATDISDKKRLRASRMRLLPQLKLGIRNTFNLPAKFILLLLVYLFVIFAVVSQYAATKENLHQSEIHGGNDFFQDASIERIVLKKNDKSAFTDADINTLKSIENVDYVVVNDLGLDNGLMTESEDIDISGPTYPMELVDPDRITIGGPASDDYDIVLEVSPDSWSYDSIMMLGDEIIGKKYYVMSYGMMSDYETRLTDKKVRIAGVIVRSEEEEAAMTRYSDYSIIYISDKLATDSQISSVISNSNVTIDFSGIKTQYDQRVLYPSELVAEGEVLIFEEVAESYYEEGRALEKTINIDVKNMYFDSSLKELKITTIVTPDSIQRIMEIDKENYEEYMERIYINPKDFNKLYDKGFFQVSVFIEDETMSAETTQAIRDAGFTAIAMKDIISTTADGDTFIESLIAKLTLALICIVLFFIAYAVIRLIMRSRNPYYSTLRILGASKGNTARILRVELVLMMAIACLIAGGIIYALMNGYLDFEYTEYFTERLKFLANRDYIILAVVLLLMSLLIANRYARRIFKYSAMNVYREEV